MCVVWCWCMLVSIVLILLRVCGLLWCGEWCVLVSLCFSIVVVLLCGRYVVNSRFVVELSSGIMLLSFSDVFVGWFDFI